jgi:hypothetical protein
VTVTMLTDLLLPSAAICPSNSPINSQVGTAARVPAGLPPQVFEYVSITVVKFGMGIGLDLKREAGWLPKLPSAPRDRD